MESVEYNKLNEKEVTYEVPLYMHEQLQKNNIKLELTFKTLMDYCKTRTKEDIDREIERIVSLRKKYESVKAQDYGMNVKRSITEHLRVIQTLITGMTPEKHNPYIDLTNANGVTEFAKDIKDLTLLFSSAVSLEKIKEVEAKLAENEKRLNEWKSDAPIELLNQNVSAINENKKFLRTLQNQYNKGIVLLNHEDLTVAEARFNRMRLLLDYDNTFGYTKNEVQMAELRASFENISNAFKQYRELINNAARIQNEYEKEYNSFIQSIANGSKKQQTAEIIETLEETIPQVAIDEKKEPEIQTEEIRKESIQIEKTPEEIFEEAKKRKEKAEKDLELEKIIAEVKAFDLEPETKEKTKEYLGVADETKESEKFSEDLIPGQFIVFNGHIPAANKENYEILEKGKMYKVVSDEGLLVTIETPKGKLDFSKASFDTLEKHYNINLGESVDIYEMTKAIALLNPNAEIRLGNSLLDSQAHHRFFSSVPGEKLFLPSGFYYNEKNGITNKHKTKSGMYVSFKVEDLALANKDILLDTTAKIDLSGKAIEEKVVFTGYIPKRDPFMPISDYANLKFGKEYTIKNKSSNNQFYQLKELEGKHFHSSSFVTAEKWNAMSKEEQEKLNKQAPKKVTKKEKKPVKNATAIALASAGIAGLIFGPGKITKACSLVSIVAAGSLAYAKEKIAKSGMKEAFSSVKDSFAKVFNKEGVEAIKRAPENIKESILSILSTSEPSLSAEISSLIPLEESIDEKEKGKVI